MDIHFNPVSDREIPPPPGGGSWRFDEAAWEWVRTAGLKESGEAQPEPQNILSEE